MLSNLLLVYFGAFIVNLNLNFNILKQFNCALVGQISDLISSSYINVTRQMLILPECLMWFMFERAKNNKYIG
jgi:hypothetical protein